MRLAKITGTVVATRKDETLTGYKLMIVRRIDSQGNFIDSEEVAVDYVGAGVGEVVLIGQGSSVRVDKKKREAVIDMAIIGIVDTVVG
ncbi:EutN/CcmL family microcompartment protein [Lacrimispora aerotolerans]|uniref:EutN/CcmL family microcompartment protein n=1 Tax=Lacrimispora aerotolerans TaxID=36832 RepID=UPI00047B7F42|nr:EutN/CcmL family microcompartment protein [Lacrimispora aerotolerans]